MQITPGDSRDHRPDLHQVMLELLVAHQAGLPLWMQPLSGNRSDPVEFGQVVDEHIAQVCRAEKPLYLVADSALYSAENLRQFAPGARKWSTRGPATLKEVQAPLAPPLLETMTSLPDGYRSRTVSSRCGAVEQRWFVVYAAARQQRLQATGDNQLARHSDQERQAFKQRCVQTCACEPDARQALEQGKAT